jgi:hypothetical protein
MREGRRDIQLEGEADVPAGGDNRASGSKTATRAVMGWLGTDALVLFARIAVARGHRARAADDMAGEVARSGEL